jgi:hypothetical protein
MARQVLTRPMLLRIRFCNHCTSGTCPFLHSATALKYNLTHKRKHNLWLRPQPHHTSPHNQWMPIGSVKHLVMLTSTTRHPCSQWTAGRCQVWGPHFSATPVVLSSGTNHHPKGRVSESGLNPSPQDRHPETGVTMPLKESGGYNVWESWP